jgi:hypothetical protein
VIFVGNSVIRVPSTARGRSPARQAKAKCLLARYITVFQAKSGLAPNEILERFQAKWKPVRVEKTRQIKNLEPRFDSIEVERL